ncbi:MAG: hypothetical protein ACRDHL_04180 [Candidatus Promineifilaceae bacterium]
MFKKVIGIVLILLSGLGLIISVAGLLLSGRFVDDFGAGTLSALETTSLTLQNTRDTLEITNTALDQAGGMVSSAADTTEGLAQVISDTQPVLETATGLATQRVPQSLDTIEAAIPNMAETAGAVDGVMRTLSAFEFSGPSILGQSFGFDLGVEYDPEIPLDETVLELGAGLDGLAEELRSLEPSLLLATDSFGALSADIDTIGGQLQTMSGTLDNFGPAVDAYIGLIDTTLTRTERTQRNLEQQLANLTLGLRLLFLWFAIYQIVPFLVGSTWLAEVRVHERAALAAEAAAEAAAENDV